MSTLSRSLLPVLIICACMGIRFHAAAFIALRSPPEQEIARFVESLQKKFERRPRSSTPPAALGETAIFSQDAVNEFINEILRINGQDEIKNARIILWDEKTFMAGGSARVNWKNVLNSGGDSFFSGLLGGMEEIKIIFEANIQSASANGKIYFHVRSLQVNGIELPRVIIDKLMAYAGQRLYPPINFHGLVGLPYGIQKIAIHKGTISVHY